ncbi:MAG: hypothetical protein WC455_19285 [Dehalococcoidia bacterium]|jgi:hypothetical protein
MAIIQSRDVKLPDGRVKEQKPLMSGAIRPRDFNPQLPNDPDVLSKARPTNAGKGGRMFSKDLRDLNEKRSMLQAQAEKKTVQAKAPIDSQNKKGGARKGAGRPKKQQ